MMYKKLRSFMVVKAAVGFALLVGLTTDLSRSIAQEFELSASGIPRPSTASLTPDSLRIQDASGGVTMYLRQRNLDSAEGTWLGFENRSLRQAILWPRSSQGKMQIGTIDGRGGYSFRPSQMTIRSMVNEVNRRPIDEVLPNTDLQYDSSPLPADWMKSSHTIRLAQHGVGQQQFLTSIGAGRLSLANASSALRDWTMIPVANGFVRFQTQIDNRWMSLGCHPDRPSQIQLLPLSGNASQLWRVFPCSGLGGYALENAMFPGQALAWNAGGVFLQALNFNPNQLWMPLLPPAYQFDPVFKTTSQRVIPNPPLPPAQVEVQNQHAETIWVMIADLRQGGSLVRKRILAGASEIVEFDRDSGSKIIEEYEIRSASGLWDRQEFVTPIPPSMLYDISVYEEFLQSIAIDRTGKSANPIEDINYQPKSVGWFPIPPGTSLSDSSQLDAYGLAKAANNPGGVRRIDPKLLEKKTPAEDPLKNLLREFQSKRAAF